MTEKKCCAVTELPTEQLSLETGTGNCASANAELVTLRTAAILDIKSASAIITSYICRSLGSNKTDICTSAEISSHIYCLWNTIKRTSLD
jgi:hypothetical protein